MKINKQSLKILKKQVKDVEEAHAGVDGVAEVNVEIKSEEELYSAYCPSTKRLLNPDLVEYIEEYTTGVMPSEEYKINIITKPLTDKSKTQISNTIRRTFVEKMADANIELKNTLIKSLCFALVGFAFLGMLIIASAKNLGFAVTSLLEVLTWVFVWEAVDCFFMSRFKQKRRKQKYAKLAVSQIGFKEG